MADITPTPIYKIQDSAGTSHDIGAKYDINNNEIITTYANQNAFSNIKIKDTTIAADSTTDTLTLEAGSNVTLTPDTANDKVTIAASNDNTTYTISTGTENGTISVQASTASSATDVAVKGLGTAAYTDSTAYDAAGEASTVQNNLTSHISDADPHVTSTNKANWNAAYTHSTSDHAPVGAQANVIEEIKVNGTKINPTNKSVDISVPTNTNQLTNGAGYLVASDIANKADKGNSLSAYGIEDAYDKASGEALATTLTALKEDVDAFFSNADLTENAKDTLKEIQDYIESDAQAAAAMTASINGKADKAESLSGYGITNAYTKTEVDNKISDLNDSIDGKADKDHDHEISDVTGLQTALDGKSDTSHNHICYGVCSDAKDVAAKTVDEVPNFELKEGAMIAVKFTNENSASSPTLNVNNTGAKPIYRYGTTAVSTATTTTGWIAGAVQVFIYDGTGWVRDYWSNTTYTNVALGQGYATCSTAEATTAKVGTLSSYTLTAGGIVSVKFTNAVPANATLNINSKGAKNIYYRGAKITNGVIKAGDVATFIYTTYYHLISIDRWQKDIESIQTSLDSKMNKENPTGTGSFSLNRRADADIGDYSVAEGYNTEASGECSHAEGCATTASGEASHAEGCAEAAFGPYSHAEGSWTIAGGRASHAEGGSTNASGDQSHAEGFNTTASGNESHAEGSATLASGYASHVEGRMTQALGYHSHAEGGAEFEEDYGNIEKEIEFNNETITITGPVAYGKQSHAEGSGTFSGGYSSHAEGVETEALGLISHAEGAATIASGEISHAEGCQTTASGDCQHVQGKYNIEDTEGVYAHIVGNGDYNARSNAHTLDWDGNAWFAGGVTATSFNGCTIASNVPANAKFTDTTYTHPTTSGNKHIPSGGSSGQFLKWSSDGTATWAADNNTTYSAGTGISLSGTTFSNSGVRSIATGSSNGTISVNTNGTSANVAVKGLGSAAYTASTAYATAAQGTKADNAMPKSGGTFTGAVSGTNVSLSGSLYVGGKTSTTDGKTGVAFGSSGNITMQGSSEPTINFILENNTSAYGKICGSQNTEKTNHGLHFKVANGHGVALWDSTSDIPCYFRPLTSGKTGLGSENIRWYRLWAANSTNVSSDEREKSDIMSMDDYPVTYSRDGSGNVFEKLFDKLIPKTYTLNIEPTDEIHMGFIAQDVSAAFEELGLSEDDLGFISHSYWTDEETGEEKDRYGLAYEEFIALNTYMIQKQRDKITTLEERIAQLEKIIDNK